MGHRKVKNIWFKSDLLQDMIEAGGKWKYFVTTMNKFASLSFP